MKKNGIILITGLLIIAFAVLIAEDDEDKSEMKFKKLPKKVQQAFKTISDVKLISEIEMEKEGKDDIDYAIETEKGKVETSYIFTQDGVLTEIKKTIDPDDLPEATRKLLIEKYPEFEIKEVEEVREISYEIEGRLDGKTVVIEISNDEDKDDDAGEEDDDDDDNGDDD